MYKASQEEAEAQGAAADASAAAGEDGGNSGSDDGSTVVDAEFEEVNPNAETGNTDSDGTKKDA
jgi:hypothetical protein